MDRTALAKQLVHEVIIDREFVYSHFAEQGGAKQLNKVLKNQLDEVLPALNDSLWDVSAPPKTSINYWLFYTY